MTTPFLPPRPLLVGATASDPAHSVEIWNAIRGWFVDHGLPFEYALYATYDGLCGALLRGEVDIAWNAPMAHAQAVLVSEGACRTLAMRDTDQDVRSLLLTKAGSGITSPADLIGRRVALGVPTSSELRLLPVYELRALGIDLETECDLVELEPRVYSNGASWVDDRLLFDALLAGEADAVALFEPWLAPLSARRGVPAEDLVVVWASEPYNHCAFTARPGLAEDTGKRFVDLLVAMDPAEPAVAKMMQLEHLTRWLPAQKKGWATLMNAIDDAGLAGSTFV